jgi:FMN-dependent NADH-azoreductase
MSLLHLDSSANRSGESISRELTARYAERWRTAHPTAPYRYRDLAADPVPPVGTGYCTLGRRVERHGGVPLSRVGALAADADERCEWELSRPLIDELLAADTVLIGAPMYNLSVPVALKAWIDRVTFPGAYLDPDTGAPLLRDTRVVVLGARGGAYGPGTPQEGNDFHTPYLRAWFVRQGVAPEHLRFVHAELALADLAPALARFRPQAARSLAAARTATDAAATWRDSAAGGDATDSSATGGVNVPARAR